MDRRRFLAAAAAPLVLGRMPAAWTRSRSLALVTADLEASVVVVELGAGRVLRRIATPAGPRSIERVGAFGALVAHTASGRISVVDARSLEVDEVDGAFGAPRYTAARADGRLAYVSDSARAEVVVVDVARRRALARLEVDGPARHLSLAPHGRRLWVALGSKAPRIAVLDLDDARRPRLLRFLTPPFLAHDVGFTPDGRKVWVTSGDRERLAVYTPTGRLLGTLRSDAPPQHASFLGGRAFVTSGDDAVLRVHSLSDGAVLRSTPIPAGSYNVQQGAGVVLTPSLAQGTLCIVGERGALLERLRVARSSHDACVVAGL
jgi:hypothetical protein